MLNAELQKAIERNEAEIEEIAEGKRHTEFHEQVMAE